jgi:hypothetical protein
LRTLLADSQLSFGEASLEEKGEQGKEEENEEIGYVQGQEQVRRFYMAFVEKALVTGQPAVAAAAQEALAAEGEAPLDEEQLRCAHTCAAAFSLRAAAAVVVPSNSGQTSGHVQAAAVEMAEKALESALDQLWNGIRAGNAGISRTRLHVLLRALGRLRFTSAVLETVAAMQGAPRKAHLAPDSETLQFLTNALVLSVGEKAVATSMAKLPQPDLSSPEVVFVGRSNVGKSSLVNMLTNRRTLAATSATPGETARFHFFSVNGNRPNGPTTGSTAGSAAGSTAGSTAGSVPAFQLVDVPGLGYAEAAQGQQDSWQGLLERYMR